MIQQLLKLLPLRRMARPLEILERGSRVLRGIGSGAYPIAQEVSVASRFLPPAGAIVFDVGANAGHWTRALLNGHRERLGRVVMFEPSPHHRDALISMSGGEVEYVPKAVGESDGVAVLYGDQAGSGLASLHQRRLDHLKLQHVRQAEVETVSLDNYTRSRGIDRIDFLKLDIEGHELKALIGASELLRGRAIGALSFEFGGANIDSRTYFQDFWYLFRERGYKIARILPNADLLPILKYVEALEVFTTTNYVAFLP